MTRLTTSEARAEAATIVLRLLLLRHHPTDYARLYNFARDEARAIGLAAIEEEVAWLFSETPEAQADAWNLGS